MKDADEDEHADEDVHEETVAMKEADEDKHEESEEVARPEEASGPGA